jgi:UDP-N-acetyl-D-galactosamine dehydrogenase
MGITFKEDCPDIRNSKVADLIREIESWGVKVVAVDCWANPAEVAQEYGIQLGSINQSNPVDSLIVTVGHSEYRHLSPTDLMSLCTTNHKPVIGDLKSLYDRHALADQGFTVFRL